MSTKDKSELQITQELFEFLQGNRQGSKKKGRFPKLSADQAWTVIWYLGSLHHQIRDHIERCDVCGDLFDSDNAGDCLDYGKLPYHFCESCMEGPEYAKKAKRRKDHE